MALNEEERRERHRARSRAWALKNPDYQKEYYRANKERILRERRPANEEDAERQRGWNRRHRARCPDKVRAAARLYREEHPGESLERARRYRQTAKGRATAARRDAKRRAILGDTECTLTHEEWEQILERNKHRCYYCGKKLKRLTMDHVVPLSKGGKHTKENIVPACKSCNSRKYNHLWFLC